MRRKIALLLCAVMACLLTGCPDGGGSSGATANYGMSDGLYLGSSKSSSVDSYESNEVAGDGSSYVEEAHENEKRIYTGWVSLETVRFDDAMQMLEQMVLDAGGYFEENEVSRRSNVWGESDSYREADLTIRVPVDQFDSMIQTLNEAKDIAVLSQRVSSEDVSEQYYDVQTRLKNAREEVEQLQKLLEQASTIEDLISVQSALSEATSDLESFQGQLNHMDSRILYSYLYVDLQEVTALTMSARAVNYGSKLLEGVVQGFTGGVEFLADLLLWVVSNWLVLAVLCTLIGLFVRWRRKRKHGSVRRFRRKAKYDHIPEPDPEQGNQFTE